MLKLIIGVKGTGKTKTLISMVNEAADTSKGTVVCVEKGTGLRFDVKYSVRLIDTDEYRIYDAKTLYGFIAGMLASNHDVTDLFVDSAFKIIGNDKKAFEEMVEAIDKLAEEANVKVVMTCSIPVEETDEVINKYL